MAGKKIVYRRVDVQHVLAKENVKQIEDWWVREANQIKHTPLDLARVRIK